MSGGARVALRIVVESPPPGVASALQSVRDGLQAPDHASAATFSFELRTGDPLADGRPDLLGAFAQGAPAVRFVRVNAGQPDSPWDRRARVALAGIDANLLQSALDAPHGVIEARIAGTARDGGPACATVPLLGDGRALAPHRAGAAG